MGLLVRPRLSMDWYYLYVSVPIVIYGIWPAGGLIAPRGYVTYV